MHYYSRQHGPMTTMGILITMWGNIIGANKEIPEEFLQFSSPPVK